MAAFKSSIQSVCIVFVVVRFFLRLILVSSLKRFFSTNGILILLFLIIMDSELQYIPSTADFNDPELDDDPVIHYRFAYGGVQFWIARSRGDKYRLMSSTPLRQLPWRCQRVMSEYHVKDVFRFDMSSVLCDGPFTHVRSRFYSLCRAYLECLYDDWY